MVDQIELLPAHLRVSYEIPTIFNRRQSGGDQNEKQQRIRRRRRAEEKKIGICRFSPFEPLIAVVMENDCSVAIWSYEEEQSQQQQNRIGLDSKTIQPNRNDPIKLLCSIRHTRPIDQIVWLDQHFAANQGQTRILMTRTIDQVYRIWTTTIDDMHSMHLAAVVDQQLSSNTQQQDNNDILGLSIEQWDEVQRKKQVQRLIDSPSQKESTLYVWHSPSDPINRTNQFSLLAMANGMDLTILSPQKLTLWQRTLLSCGIAINHQKSTETINTSSTQQQNELYRMGLIANLNLANDKSLCCKDDSIKDIHWISDNHILIGLKMSEKAILLDGTKAVVQKSKKLRAEDDGHHQESLSPSPSSLSQIAKIQSLPLPVQNVEVLLRCAYWGQLAKSMQIILKACRDDDEKKEISQIDWPQKELIINSTPAERQMEMMEVIGEEEERMMMQRKAVNEEEEDLTKMANEVILKEEHKWNKMQGNELKSQKNDHNKISTIVNVLFDLRKLIGQLDDCSIRYVVNALYPSIYYDQTLSSPFAQYDSSAALLEPNESISTLSGRETFDSILTKTCLHAWFSSTQEALFQYVESTMLTRMSSSSTITKSDDETLKTTIKLDWTVARKLGIFLWLRQKDQIRSCLESIARTQYTKDEKNDPTSCSLLYYALGKQKLVLQLWRQSVWHSEYNKMMKFLQNDFGLERWRSAAKKNAFALLSQRRFQMAASFFLLGNSLEDAVNVCTRNLFDVSLAIAICRVWHDEREGQRVFRNLIVQVILPNAFKNKDRFTSLWSTEVLGRRDLSLQIVQSTDLESTLKGVGEALEIATVKEERGGGGDHVNVLKDVDDLLFFKSISNSNLSIETNLLENAIENLRQDGLIELAKSVQRDWKVEKDQQVETNQTATFTLFDCDEPIPIKTNDTKEEIVGQTTKPTPAATQLVKSELAANQTSSSAVSAGDLAFDLDSWGM